MATTSSSRRILVSLVLLAVMVTGALVALFNGFAGLVTSLVLGTMLLVAAFKRNLEIPLLIVAIPVRGFALLTIVDAHIRPSDPILLAILAIYMARWLGKKARGKYNLLDVTVCAFVAMHLLSVLWAPDRIYASIRALNLARDLAFYLVVRGWLSQDFERRVKQLAAALAVTVWMLGIVFINVIGHQGGLPALADLISSGQSLVSGQLLAVVRGSTGGGVLMDSVDLWYVMALGILAGSWPLFRGAKTVLGRLWIPSSIVLILTLSILTLRRSAFTALAVLLLVALVQLRNRLEPKIYKRMIAAGVLAALLLLTTGFYNVLWRRISPETLMVDQAISTRFWLWGIAWKSFLQSFPLLGTGAGNSIPGGVMVHNLYLQVLAETGVIGFFIFLVMILTWVVYLRRLSSDRTNHTTPILSSLLLGCTLAYLMWSFTGTDFASFEPWLLLAATSALWVKQHNSAQEIAVESFGMQRRVAIPMSGERT